MASPQITPAQTNPFTNWSPEDQAEIRRQLVEKASDPSLSEQQKRGVALALTQMGAATGFPSTSQPDATPETPSLWDKANTGLVSPDTILKLAAAPLTGPMKVNLALTRKLGLPAPNIDLSTPSVADLAKMGKTGDPTLSPVKNALLSGISGAGADTASTVSGFTSPISIATLAAGPFAKGAGVAPKALRALMTAFGLAYGAQGVGNVAEGVGEGVTTPEGAQKALSGAAQVAGAAPAVGEIGAAIKGAAQHLVPQAFAEGENAFVKVLNPAKKTVPAIRDAYKAVAPELANAPVKDLPDLESYADARRTQVADQLKQQLSATNPQATKIDPMSVYRAIRGQINEAMTLGSPAEARAIAKYAERVKDHLTNNPIDITQAEQLAQQINRRTSQFQRMSPDAKYTAGSQGNPNAAEIAFKNALQDQIEAKLSNYRDLKRQYGSWKEIQNQTNSEMDRIAKEKGPNFLQRHALEGILGMAGAAFGYGHGGVEAGTSMGLLSYLAGRSAADVYLNRLASPERMMQRALKPQVQRPIPFTGQVVQPVAQSLVNGGGTAF